MDYLQKLKIQLNRLKDKHHDLWKSPAINIEDKDKLSFEFDLEIHRTELLIIEEEKKCLQENITERFRFTPKV